MAEDNGSQNAVLIERSFDAPVDLIWQMWTDPEHFKAWYGPDGASMGMTPSSGPGVTIRTVACHGQ